MSFYDFTDLTLTLIPSFKNFPPYKLKQVFFDSRVPKPRDISCDVTNIVNVNIL